MIFRTENKDFNLLESYKERNLYYKIFCGYLLNEIVDDYNDRKQKLLQLLMSTRKDKERFKDPLNKAQTVFEELASDEVDWNITFDYHIKQFSTDKEDRGEMSDMLLRTKLSMVSFEYKLNCNVDFEKDILKVQDRIKCYQDESKTNLAALQILLIKKAKWDGMKRHQRQRGSVYLRLQQADLEIPVMVVFWEELLPLIPNPKVFNYLKEVLK